jgi:hypothetical protein
VSFLSLDKTSLEVSLLICLATHDPKMKTDPGEKIMLSKSVELLIVIAPKAPT